MNCPKCNDALFVDRAGNSTTRLSLFKKLKDAGWGLSEINSMLVSVGYPLENMFRCTRCRHEWEIKPEPWQAKWMELALLGPPTEMSRVQLLLKAVEQLRQDPKAEAGQVYEKCINCSKQDHLRRSAEMLAKDYMRRYDTLAANLMECFRDLGIEIVWGADPADTALSTIRNMEGK